MVTATNYDKNAESLDAAEAAVETWATFVTPEDARRDIRAHLLGALMARVDPDTFATLLRRAEYFAGRPHDEDPA